MLNIDALPLLVLMALAGLAAAAVLGQPARLERRRERRRNGVFPPAWRRILRQRVPAVASLQIGRAHV